MLKYLALLSGALLVVGVSLAGTFALFSANAAAPVNTFTAGTFCLTAQRSEDATYGPMFYITDAAGAGYDATGIWAPGDTHMRGLDVHNACNLNGWLTSVSALPITTSLLDKALNVQVEAFDPYQNAFVQVADAPLSDFLAGDVAIKFPADWNNNGVFTPYIPIWKNGGQESLMFNVTLDHSAGNQYQGLTEVVTFVVHGQQMANNPNPTP